MNTKNKSYRKGWIDSNQLPPIHANKKTVFITSKKQHILYSWQHLPKTLNSEAFFYTLNGKS